jgi:2-haloacid dehalogenase
MSTPATSGPVQHRPAADVTAVVFDLGGVLIDWDPRYLYRTLLETDDEIDAFLHEVGFARWNHEMDAGEHTWAEAVEALTARHPHHRHLIEAYPLRFAETVPGPIHGTVELLAELHSTGTTLLALTNWSAETFSVARERFEFLQLFDGIVVSGEERLAKPDPAIFRVLVDRYALDPARTMFVDDRQANVDAAESVGLRGALFTGPEDLRDELSRLSLLPRAAAGSG